MKAKTLVQKRSASAAAAMLMAVKLALLAGAGSAAAQGFNSGSNGSYGPLTGGQVTLPPDGILHCTTVDIPNNQTLSFIKNSANTPVYILATGDVRIAGSIQISGGTSVEGKGGEGGPGGFPGGQGAQGNSLPSDGYGPGGGKGGWFASSGLPAGRNIRGGGGFGTPGTQATTGGAVYGNSLLIPLVGGSGGGGADHTEPQQRYGGGGGGGAILIASNTKITFEQTNFGTSTFASGGTSPPGTGSGSGGAIRLVAPIVTGGANFRVSGSGYGGGYGRIRIDSLNNTLSSNPLPGDDSYLHSTSGSNMVVFPPNMPSLQVTEAAGQTIAPGRTEPVFVMLPTGSAAAQTVKVNVSNFHAIVPLRATVTPESGTSSGYDFQVDNRSGGSTEGTVQVQVPAGVSTRIDVWTR